MKPFLYPENNEEYVQSANHTNVELDPSQVHIHYAYIVSSSYCLVTTIIFMIVTFKLRNRKPAQNVTTNLQKKYNVRPMVRNLIVAIGSAFLFCYFALELAVGSFLVAFARKYVKS